MKIYGECKTYGFNLWRWIKDKLQKRKGWRKILIDISGCDDNEEEN